MSRKYLNERWCIRCNRRGPTPYLKKHWEKLVDPKNKKSSIVDIGCGNGRNSEFFKEMGFKDITSFDMVDDYGIKLTLGSEGFPLPNQSVDAVIANYIFMFLSPKERRQVTKEIKRVAKPGCMIMVELYPAKDSFAKDQETSDKLLSTLIESLGSDTILKSKDRFVACYSPK